MGMKTARAEQLPFLEALGLYHFAATGEGEPYLFARLGRLDSDAAPFRNVGGAERSLAACLLCRVYVMPCYFSLSGVPGNDCPPLSVKTAAGNERQRLAVSPHVGQGIRMSSSIPALASK